MIWNLKGQNKKKLLKWGFGFLSLFLFNVVVESIVLPALDLDNTPKNDLYFQAWWACTVLWLFFGLRLLKWKSKKTDFPNDN